MTDAEALIWCVVITIMVICQGVSEAAEESRKVYRKEQEGEAKHGSKQTPSGADRKSPPLVQPTPTPEPTHEPTPICSNACGRARNHNGDCDDGGDGAEYAVCPYGTDCGDCGIRAGARPSPPPPPPDGYHTAAHFDQDLVDKEQLRIDQPKLDHSSKYAIYGAVGCFVLLTGLVLCVATGTCEGGGVCDLETGQRHAPLVKPAAPSPPPPAPRVVPVVRGVPLAVPLSGEARIDQLRAKCAHRSDPPPVMRHQHNLPSAIRLSTCELQAKMKEDALTTML